MNIYTKRSYADRLSAAFEYFGQHWIGIFTPFLMFVAPILIIAGGYSSAIGYELSTKMAELDTEEILKGTDILAQLNISYSQIMIIGLIGLLSAALSYSVVGSYIKQEQESNQIPSPKDVIGQALPYVLPLALLYILISVFTGLGMLFLIVGGLIVITFLSSAYPAIIMEDLNPFQALTRSFNLVKRNFFGVLVYFITIVILLAICSLILTSILSFVSTLGLNIYYSSPILGIIILGLFSIILYPLNFIMYIAMFFQYGSLASEDTNVDELENTLSAL